MKKSIIVCDIDGILTVETKGHDYATRTPNLINIDKLNSLTEKGHIVILHTARWSIDREKTTKWLRKHGVRYTKVIFGKPYGDFYIDDKACSLDELVDK